MVDFTWKDYIVIGYLSLVLIYNALIALGLPGLYDPFPKQPSIALIRTLGWTAIFLLFISLRFLIIVSDELSIISGLLGLLLIVVFLRLDTSSSDDDTLL